ncbi:hypothetical protein AB0A73_05035 [Glycomyces sp. NPDC047369]
MRFRRALVGALTALMAAVAVLAVAEPAAAAIPRNCSRLGYDNGRAVHVTNDNNGGGAEVYADLCYSSIGANLYEAYVIWNVLDTKENGAGATIRMEWQDWTGDMHYDVPDADGRAWNYGDSIVDFWTGDNLRGLYVRACLTNTFSEGHHCGPKA